MNMKAAIPVLIIINAVIFGAWKLVPGMEEAMFRYLALYFPQHPSFIFWQFLTNMFMHGSFFHILFNMYALWAFGSPLEFLWGKGRFLLFYFLCGLGAGVVYTAVNYFQFNNIYQEMIAQGIGEDSIRVLLQTGNIAPELLSAFSQDRLQTFYNLFNIPVVGASGAIYGILVAFGILFPNAKLMLIFLPFPIAAKYFIPILIAIDLFSGVTGFSLFGGGVAHFGHIGGAAIGFLLMWYWKQKGIRRHGPFDGAPMP